MTDQDVARPVREQLAAYNRRDIEGFMRWWTADCEFNAFPDQPLAVGADEVRARHRLRFKDPLLHGELIGRLVVGHVVIDQERVTRHFDGVPGVADVTAIYEVREGLIARAWFVQGEPRALGPSSACL